MSSSAGSVGTFRFDQMATLINDRVDNPAESGVERYVGLEHLDADSLRIQRWGEITDVESTKLRFQPGDIIFGKRRVYQRKLAVADFEGICSAHAMVLRAKPDVVLPEFLPFFMQSDRFMERALEISVGSLSPTINWKTLAAEEFALPPMEEQRRIVALLRAFDLAIARYETAMQRCGHVVSALSKASFGNVGERDTVQLRSLVSKLGSGKTPTGGETVYVRDGVMFLRSQNIYADGLRLDDVAYISTDIDESMSSTRVHTGDVLLNITGASIGRCTIYTLERPANVNQHVCILRPTLEMVDPWYLTLFLQSQYGQLLIASLMTNGNRQGLNFEQLGAFGVPMLPREAQRTIGRLYRRIVESRKSLELRRASIVRIRSSTLARALTEPQ